MNNQEQFEQFREKYKEFHFNNYLVKEDNETIQLEYEFEIPNLTKFNPKIKILKKELNFKNTRKPCCAKHGIPYRSYRTNKLLEMYMFT